MRAVACVILPTMLLVACAHDTTAPNPMALSTTPAGPATLLPGAPVVALQRIDAPGFSIEDLTARVRDGLVWGSGVIVVDALSVRAELAACVEMPCVEVQQDLFRSARLTATVGLSRVGASVLGALRISRGIHEIARVNAEGTDVSEVATRLGREGGAALRRALLATTTMAPDVPEVGER